MRHRSTRQAVALGAAIAAFAATATPAGATVTDATDGYRLGPANQRLSAGETQAPSLQEAAATVMDDAIRKTRDTDAVARAEARLRDAGVDTDAVRADIRRRLRDAGKLGTDKLVPGVRRELRDAGIDPANLRATVRGWQRGGNADTDRLANAIRRGLRSTRLDPATVNDAATNAVGALP